MITKLGLVQLGFTPEVDFSLQDDSDGNDVYIAEWNSASPQPSEAEIEAAHTLGETAQANAVAQKAADKQSAHDKLSALGLTDAEIEAIT
jgi:hypothetical protein|tara:strand:- start:586 stop:855 length:270 start_codon:yes stop_codon:yes gene_type:complete